MTVEQWREKHAPHMAGQDFEQRPNNLRWIALICVCGSRILVRAEQ